MWFAFMISQRFIRVLWASLGFLRGSWEVLGVPLGILGRPLLILGVIGGPLGVPLGSMGVPGGVFRRGAKKDRKHIMFSWSVGGGGVWGPWGSFWSSGEVLRSSPGGANVDLSKV